MKKSFVLMILVSAGITLSLHAQTTGLKPGFNKKEYMDMLVLARHQVDTPWTNIKTPLPPAYRLAYRSPTVGLENRWDLFTARDTQAVISIRGTTLANISWLANIYAAMVPAKGSIKISNSFTFDYRLADDDKATVHIGWLIGMACLSQTILPKIDSCYKKGIRNMIVTGHSQGGGIAFLLASHLLSLQKQGKLPADIRFKTYCSAGPKPGNLYYAYAFENATYGGWGFNVVNAADWVPEVPFSIQTDKDFNVVNPFRNIDDVFKKQKFPVDIYLKSLYKGLTNPLKKSQTKFTRFSSGMLYKIIKKVLPEYVQPVLAENNNFQRTGTCVVLLPDAQYYQDHPEDPARLFGHHMPEAYYELAERTLK